MNKDIEPLLPSLNNIFDRYKDQGLKAIYLWGSITTPTDFDIKTSDVDTLGIADDNMDLELQDVIRKQLQAEHPELVKFGFNLLYEKSLKTGEPFKSRLTKVIPPRFLLSDFPFWYHVAGKKYSMGDFTDNPPPHTEALECLLSQVKNRGWSNAHDVEPGSEIRLPKILWRVIYLLQIIRGCEGIFSRSFVALNANKKEKEMVDILKSIKSSGYDRSIFMKHADYFNEFLKDTRSVLNKI